MAASISPAHSSAMEVGKAFIQQFYTVLHSRPKYLHRFYTNNSSLTIGEQDGPPSTTVTGQQSIHDLWMTLELEGASAAITSVDAQPSHCQGVVVFVTGELQGRGGRKRTFVQIFYLAVQDKGYYVLNDIFRYMPDGVAYGDSLAEGAAPADAAQPNGYAAPPQIADGTVQQMAQADASTDTQQGQTAAAASQPEQARPGAYDEPALPAPEAAPLPPPPPTQQPQHQHEAVEERQAPPQPPPQHQQQQQQPAEAAAAPSSAPAAEAPPVSAEHEPEAAGAEQHPAAAAPAAAEEEPAAAPADEPPPPPPEPAVPLTYAQRLKLGAAQASAPPPKPKPAAAPRPADAAPKPGSGDGAAPLANGQADAGSYPAYPYVSNDEALSQSIFVKDLPQDITVQRLADEFARFGPLRNGVRGVNLKAQKDKATFAFIEFESEDSARAAVTSTNMAIDGQPVKIDEKKPLYMTRGRNRAEFGRGGRGSDFPGRGYMGGRGDRGGRGGLDFSGGRGRGPSRGGYMGSRGPPGGERGGRGRGPPGRGAARMPPSRDGPSEEAAPQEAAPAAPVEA